MNTQVGITVESENPLTGERKSVCKVSEKHCKTVLQCSMGEDQMCQTVRVVTLYTF